mgnify:CR=1 FL=1
MKDGKIMRGYQDYRGSQYQNMFINRRSSSVIEDGNFEIGQHLLGSVPMDSKKYEVRQLNRKVVERDELRTSLIDFDIPKNLEQVKHPNQMRLEPLKPTKVE